MKKYNQVTNKKEATETVLQIREDVTMYVSDTQLAKDLNIAKLTLYKRLAFSDWKAHEIEVLNEFLQSKI